MSRPERLRFVLIATALATAASAAVTSRAAQNPAPRQVQPPPEIQQAFDQQINDYMGKHRAAERELPPLPDKATPEQINKSRAGLATLIRAARADALEGAVFTAPVSQYVKDVLRRVFAGPDRATLRASIMDENPAGLRAKINETYPTEIPLSTMPPDVLAALPPIPEELEYRFVGRDLVLLDVRAELIVDVVREALPA